MLYRPDALRGNGILFTILFLSLFFISPIIVILWSAKPYSYFDPTRAVVLYSVVGFLFGNNVTTRRMLAQSKLSSKNLKFSFNLTFAVTLLLCFLCTEFTTRWWFFGHIVEATEMFVAVAALICGALLAIPIRAIDRLQIFSKSPIALLAILVSIVAPFFVFGWHVLLSFWILAPAAFFLLIRPLAARFWKSKRSDQFKKRTNKSNSHSSKREEQQKQKSHKRFGSNANKSKEPLDDDLKFFNLREGFSVEELKAARNEQLKMNHPDKVAHLSEEIQRLAEQQTKLINEVYERLLARLKSV